MAGEPVNRAANRQLRFRCRSIPSNNTLGRAVRRSPRIAPSAASSATMSTSTSMPSTRSTPRIRSRAPGGADRRRRRRHGHAGWCAIQPVSARPRFRASRCAQRGIMVGICGFHRLRRAVHAQWRRCRSRPRPRDGAFAVRGRSGSAGSNWYCATPWPCALKPLYNFIDDLPSIEGTPVAADETATHELFGTDAARAYVAHAQHVKEAQGGHAQEPAAMEAAE